MKLRFNKTAKKALEIMGKTTNNLFLTGKAGTGKSTLLDYFRKETEKRAAVLAPTGVAAINVDGETIHAFFGLKPGFELDEVTNKNPNPKNIALYTKLEMIIIDEISMVRADVLDAVNIFLQKVRENKKPFGGVQMIFIGDLYQLPPVVTSDEKKAFAEKYKSSFFFASEVFHDPQFTMDFVELDKIYRQEDNDFIEILNAVRNNSVENEHIEALNQRVDANFTDDEHYIYLMTTNADVKKVNDSKLEKLDTPELYFDAIVEGEVQKNQFPTDEELCLKVGAQVMFVNNHGFRDWVNGTIGEIVDFDEEEGKLIVAKNDGEIVEVAPHTWEISKYVLENGKFERKMIGSFTQYPVKLAWAITIHKSQGKTFEKVIIDLGRGSFAHGQTYVAFSRCTSLEGVVLSRAVKKSDIRMDWNVRKFLTDYQYRLAEKELSMEEKTALIKKAIKEKKVIKITYLKAKDEKSEREILPSWVGETDFRGHNYIGMEGMCLTRKEERLFNVARILTIEDTV